MVTVDELSDETKDNGRGITSTLSEKPTLARLKALVGAFGRLVLSTGETGTSDSVVGCRAVSKEPGKACECCTSCSPDGEQGAELPRGALLGLVGGLRIIERSCCEIAADRTCLCPRRPPGGPKPVGGGSTPSPLVGDVDIRPVPLPFSPSPPMNSLVPLLWAPDRPGIVLGDGGGLCFWDPKENGGSSGVVCVLSPSAVVVSCSIDLPANSMADTGRRPVALENEDGADAGDARAGKTKDGSGSGPSFNRGLCWSGKLGERGAEKSLIGERGEPRGRSS
jgi:hypothetical protein